MMDDFDRPWPSRRGIETIDRDIGLVLARTTVEHLASEIAPKATTWQRNVLGRSVVVAPDFGWVFRLEGHEWAIFVHDAYHLAGSPVDLSARLSVPVLAYDRSDTMCSIGYVFAEGGAVRESLSLVDGELEFSSELRPDLRPESGYQTAQQFFREQDAYEPGIFVNYFFSDASTVPRLVSGDERIVGNPGFTLCTDAGDVTTFPTFERVDYLVLGRK